MNLLRKYLSRWYFFAVSVIICLTLGYIYIYFSTPVYQINTSLLLEDDKKGDGALKETAFSDLNMFRTSKKIENEIQILQSMNIIKRALNHLNINSRVYLVDKFKKKEVYGEFNPIKIEVFNKTKNAYAKEFKIVLKDQNTFSLATDEGSSKDYKFGDTISNIDYKISVNKNGESFSLDKPELTASILNVDELAKRIRNNDFQISTVVKEANVLQLNFFDNIPERGAEIVTRIVEEYNLSDVENKNKMANATIKFIDTRIKYLSDDLGTVDKNVQEFKQQNRVTNVHSDAQSNLLRAEDYKQRLENINIQLGILNAISSYVNSADKLVPIVPGTAGLQDGSLVNLINKYNEVQENYQYLLINNQPNHPLVLTAKERLTALRENIVTNLRSIKSNLDINKNNLIANSSLFENRILSTPEIEKGLQERDRAQSVKAGLLQYLIQKREETALTLSASMPNAKVIDAASFNKEPNKPKKQFIYLYAFLFGLMVPAAGLYAKDHLNTKIDSSLEIQEQTHVKILGELCYDKSNDILAVNGHKRNNITELFRYIRTNLNQNGVDDKHNKVMLVTSSIQGEGKTFTCLNLGATLSNVDKRVVILEFDLRKPDLISKIKLDKGIGITDYLNSDEIAVDDIVRPSGVNPNLFVVGSGKTMDDPGNEIQNVKIGRLINELKEKFDYVIIDSPPVGCVADAFTLNNYSDSTIYIMRYNYTQKTHLNMLSDIEKNNKLKDIMVIINDGKVDQLKQYGYGSTVYA